jgi:ribose-phosphate pyrophosphokinase
MGKVTFSLISDGEFQPSFEESVRGRRVFIIGSTFPSSDNLMEMLLMLDAAKRASARHITAVMPYFGWARQDRKDKPRVPIGAKMLQNY